MRPETHTGKENGEQNLEAQSSPQQKDPTRAHALAVEQTADRSAEAMQREKEMREAEQIRAALAPPQKFVYGFDNPVTQKYVQAVLRANSEQNTKPVTTDSMEGKNMMSMVHECEDLLKCLKGSELHASIDGAIGLSLRQLSEKEAFLRQHRDIDLLVPEDELAAIDARLHAQADGKQWSLFVWHTDEKAKGMSFSKFDAARFQRNELLVAMPIHEDGTPDMERYDGLTMTDIHYLKNDGKDYTYNRLPVKAEHLFQSEQVSLPDGTEVPVVSLVHMAVGKAKSDRPQDNYDLQYILKTATPEQKEQIRGELHELYERTSWDTEEQARIERGIAKIR